MQEHLFLRSNSGRDLYGKRAPRQSFFENIRFLNEQFLIFQMYGATIELKVYSWKFLGQIKAVASPLKAREKNILRAFFQLIYCTLTT